MFKGKGKEMVYTRGITDSRRLENGPGKKKKVKVVIKLKRKKTTTNRPNSRQENFLRREE